MENADDVTVLHEIYQSARTAMVAIDAILAKTKDQNLAGDLSAQRTQYRDTAKKAAQQLLNCNTFPQEMNMFCKSTLWASIQFSSLLNCTPGHLAQLMINGSQKGVNELNLVLSRNAQTAQQTTDLAQEYIALEQNNMAKLNTYLS